MKTIFTYFFSFLSFSFLMAQENGGPYTPDENTVLLMHFDGDATNSANVGNDGIEHGSGVSYETGVHGQALRLDNTNADKQSWIEVPFYEELNASSNGLAVECWFKINSWGENEDGVRSLFHKDGESGSADYEIILFSENTGRNGQVNLDCEDNETQNWGADAPIADILELNTWYYIVIYYNPRFKHEYVNEEGEQRQASSVYCLIRDENFDEIFASRGHTESPPTNSNGLFRIGFGGWGDSYFDGWIDELRISNSYRKYRDDVLANVDVSSFKDSVFLPLKDRWTVYQWPLAEYYPYNPEKGDIERANACGPTMLTRGIHYWEYPRFPKGVIEHNWVGLDWYANYDETEYLWDQMPPVFNDGATVEDYGPAATLSAQVGVASRKTYDNMYCMPKFLKENFLFSKKTRLVCEEEYTKEEWENIIRNELSHGRICLVGGWGHYYIINGYNSQGQFFTDYSFNDNYWNDIKDFDYGAMQDMIIYLEPDWGDKALELEQPNSGDLYQKGSVLEIQWSSENISNMIIEYSSDAGYNWHTVADNLDANTGSYSWTIPDAVSDDYRIRISDKDNLNVYRKSSGIEVYAKKEFTFEYPLQNSKFLKGTEQTIYWQSEGIKAIKLEYSMDNTTWIILSDSLNVPGGNFSVQLPDVVTENIRLKATDLSENGSVYASESFQLVENPLWGGPYESDNQTELLMHFEEDIKNSANTVLLPYETTPIGYYEANFDNNLGKAFRNINGNIMGNAILVKNSENIDLGNNWTMEAWVNISSIMGERTVNSLIFNKWEVFEMNAGGQHFGASVNFENNTSVNFYYPNKYQLNKWYHVAMISDATQEKIYFYVHDENAQVVYQDEKPFPEGSDGMVLKKEFINDGNNKNLLTIGGLGGGSNFELDGYLDEVRITKSSKLMDYIETVGLPFDDDFEETISQDATFTKWTTQNLEGWHYWHMVTGQGVNYSQCMRFENNDVDQNDWLITRAMDCSGMNQIKINFDVLYNGNGTKPQLFYKSLNKDENSTIGWIELNYSLGTEENKWYSINEITINNPGDIIYFAFNSTQKANEGIYFLLDNFSVKGVTTSSKKIARPEIDFKIYPNPITNQSVISFQTKTSGNVNLSVFDLQGRKITTILDKKLSAGSYNYSFGNAISSEGVYFVRLKTQEGISTQKIIYMKE